MDRASNPSGHWVARLGIRLQRLRAQFNQRWWILLLCVASGLAYQGWELYRKPTVFKSTGKMMVSARLNVQEKETFSEELMHFYGTQTALMQGPEVLGRARRRVSFETPDLRGEASVQAEQIPRTSIFQVGGVGSDPIYTQRLVDAVMEEYMAFKREKRQETTDVTMVQISEELSRLRKEREQRQGELDDYVEKNNIPFWEEQSNTAARFLSELKTQQADLTKELRLLENLSADQLLANPTVKLGPGAPTPPDASSPAPAPATTDGPLLGGDLQTQFLAKKQELGQLQAEVDLLSRVLKPKHPKLVRLKEQMETGDRLLGIIRDQSKENVQSRIAALKAELESVEASVTSWEGKALEASKKGSEYKRLEAAVVRTNEIYERLLASIQSLDVSKNIGQELVQVLERAGPATEVAPGVLKHLLLGLLLGLGVGLGVLIVLDRADDRLTSFTEINEQFTLPVLGQIPHVDADLKDRHGKKMVSLIKPDDKRYMFSEAFRNLRSSLVFMPEQTDLRTLLVTSSIPGEGKTTISANLAITMAFAGARVLLVDADLKRGDLADLFDLEPKTGFSNVLKGELPWQSAVQPSGYENLSLLLRGPVLPHPAEYMLRPLMDQFLKETRAAHDLVIFNSAPILATDDTTTLAPNVDGVLLIMRAFVTSARLAENSLNALQSRQAKVLGLILNSINTQMADYYHYRYSQYYSKA